MLRWGSGLTKKNAYETLVGQLFHLHVRFCSAFSLFLSFLLPSDLYLLLVLIVEHDVWLRLLKHFAEMWEDGTLLREPCFVNEIASEIEVYSYIHLGRCVY